MMDKTGIDTAVTSISTPGVWFGDIAQARRLARLCNDFAADMARDFPGRFGTFGSLPLPDVEGSLREIEYACDTLRVDGFCLMTSYGDRWPGDTLFAPVFDELNRRKAAVFFHPTLPTCCVGLLPEIAPAATEFLFDSTRAIVSLIFSGTTTRCRDIRYIFSHGGGTLPFMVDRATGIPMKQPKLAARVSGAPIEHVRSFFYDIATVTNPIAVTALRQLVGVSQMLYGTDEPFSPGVAMAREFDKLDFTPDEAAAILRLNALRLWPHLAK